MPQQSELPPFRPHRLIRGGHAQTIASVYYPSRAPDYCAIPHEVCLDDGDRLIVHEDCPEDWSNENPVALWIHGLGGSHRSGPIARVIPKLGVKGVRCFRMDQRGSGAGELLAVGHTNAGRSDDLLAAYDYVRNLCPNSPIVLLGVSLGANILLKLLAEQGTTGLPQLHHAIAIAPPIDLAHCATNLRNGFNRVYDNKFIKVLHQTIERRRKLVDGYRDNGLDPLPSRLLEFDDAYTAPLCGYSSADDYYRACSTFNRLSEIQVDTRIITAKDDPLIPIEMFDQIRMSSSVDLCITSGGGHVGYIGQKGVDPDRFWLDWRITEAF